MSQNMTHANTSYLCTCEDSSKEPAAPPGAWRRPIARPEFDGLKIQKKAEGIKGFEQVEEGEEFGEIGELVMRGKHIGLKEIMNHLSHLS
jgi:hypothetical protein